MKNDLIKEVVDGKKYNTLKLGNFNISNKDRFILMAGPCQLEDEKHSLMLAEGIQKICDRVGINYVFKASFDKANRTSGSSKRGVSIEEGESIFRKVKKELGCAILTDLHTTEQCKHSIVETIDILQVPAFLCRQTDLVKAFCDTGKIVNMKKGQFLSPQETHDIYSKCKNFGNEKIILTDRGSCFGYNALVNDMTCYPIMAETGAPVVCDATHSVQRPGAGNGCSLGNREMAQYIARAAMAVGLAGVFMEVHQDPDTAPSDGPNMIRLDKLEEILKILLELDNVVKSKINK